MKVEITGKTKNNSLEYPKLMVDNDGLTVLFERKGVGIVLHDPHGNHPVGVSDEWHVICDFTDFNGQITLSNE